jgi:hypothetical protein
MKDGVNNSTANYSKLEMDDADENSTLGLELGLGGFGGLRGSRNDDSFDELNSLIM